MILNGDEWIYNIGYFLLDFPLRCAGSGYVTNFIIISKKIGSVISNVIIVGNVVFNNTVNSRDDVTNVIIISNDVTTVFANVIGKHPNVVMKDANVTINLKNAITPVANSRSRSNNVMIVLTGLIPFGKNDVEVGM